MPVKRHFTLNNVYTMPINILLGQASKKDIDQYRKDIKKGEWKKHFFKRVDVLLLILCLTACSCVTRKACERKFPAFQKDSVTVVTNTVTVVRDTTIYILLPGDTVYKSTNPNEGISELSTSFAHSYAWISDGKLQHRLEQNDTVVPYVVKDAIKNSITRIVTKQVSSRTIKFIELTQWQIVLIWVGKIALGVIVFCSTYFLYKIAKRH